MTSEREPALRVISGDPTPEEIAVLLTVISASAATNDEEGTATVDAWGAPAAMHRAPMPSPGVGVWQEIGR